MDDQSRPKKSPLSCTGVQKQRGRNRIRSLDDVLEDLGRRDDSDYAEMATDRIHWRSLVLEARAHVRLKKQSRMCRPCLLYTSRCV